MSHIIGVTCAHELQASKDIWSQIKTIVKKATNFIYSITVPLPSWPFSIHPPCDIDLAFWIPETFQENDFYDIVRSMGGNMVEKVELIDVYAYTKLKRTSHCYRITYRHPDRAMEKAEADAITKKIATEASAKLNVKLR